MQPEHSRLENYQNVGSGMSFPRVCLFVSHLKSWSCQECVGDETPFWNLFGGVWIINCSHAFRGARTFSNDLSLIFIFEGSKIVIIKKKAYKNCYIFALAHSVEKFNINHGFAQNSVNVKFLDV